MKTKAQESMQKSMEEMENFLGGIDADLGEFLEALKEPGLTMDFDLHGRRIHDERMSGNGKK